MTVRYNELPEEIDGVMKFDWPHILMDVFDIAMIRPRALWRGLQYPHQGFRFVQIGGGRKKIDGWEDLDYPQWDAETMPLPYEDGAIDAFMSIHALDHMTPKAVVNLLYEVQRCLAPHGTFTIVVPHFLSTLAWECIEHKSRFGIKTWRNIFDNPAYDPTYNRPIEWKLKVGFNMIMGVEERNLVLVTQLHKEG